MSEFGIGARVEKKSGSSWTGIIVGSYSTSLTPVGWAVESENEPGSVQIYPEKALRLAATPVQNRGEDEKAFCNKCGFIGVPGSRGEHVRPRDGKACNYAAAANSAFGPSDFQRGYEACREDAARELARLADPLSWGGRMPYRGSAALKAAIPFIRNMEARNG